MENKITDPLIADIGFVLRSSKNVTYRKRVTEQYSALLSFLSSNCLLARPILEQNEEISDTTKIRRSHLTDEGYQVLHMALDKWARSLDRGKSSSDTSILEKHLRKIRESA